MNIQERNISDLSFDPHQTRIHTKRNIDAIRASLKAHGQVETILVRAGANYVISGNGRLQVMRELGWQTAVCNVVDLTDSQARKLSIRMNRSGELAQWDELSLARELDEILAEGENSDSLGFSKDESAKLMASIDRTLDEALPGNEVDDLDVSFDDDIESTGFSKSVSIADALAGQSSERANNEKQNTDQTGDASKITRTALYFFVEFYGEKERFEKIKQYLGKALATQNKLDSNQFELMASLYNKYSDRQ